MSRAAAQIMRQQRAGRIINIASIAGFVPLRLQCAFVAAKAGVINLTKAMALELGPLGILVNGIAPGSTLTEGTRKLFYGEDGTVPSSRRSACSTMFRSAGPARWTKSPSLLCSSPTRKTRYMNGHILIVDGGWISRVYREF